MLVEVSEAANADLDDILNYGAERFGEDVAEAYVRRFDQVYALIADHPLIGALHRTVRPPIRSLPYVGPSIIVICGPCGWDEQHPPCTSNRTTDQI